MPEWLVFLCAVCALAEGTAERAVGDRMQPDAAAAACVSNALHDRQRRVAVLGGRDGMPRSLGSVYGGSVTRFLGGFRGGGVARVIATPGVRSCCNGVAVSRDGSVLLVSDFVANVIHLYCVHTGVFLRNIGGPGVGPLQFSYPCQVWVAPDGFVFVAENKNGRIQILTAHFGFHSFMGVGTLHWPAGVCANDDVVVVSEHQDHRLVVFGRHADAPIRCFGSFGTGKRQLQSPAGLCFMAGHRHIAVADCVNHRVSVWSLEGEFVRHVGGVKKLGWTFGVACSDGGELVVANSDSVVVFNASGGIVWTSKTCAVGTFSGVTMHGSTIIGQTRRDFNYVVFT